LQSDKKYETYKDNVTCFLKGLNSFNLVKGQIPLLDSLPLINKASAMISQQERKNSDAKPSKTLT